MSTNRTHHLKYPDADLRLDPVSAEEAGFCYTQLPGRDAEFGCVGHMLLEPGSDSHSSEVKFSSKWFPHVPELETDELREEFQRVLDGLRQHGPLQDPNTAEEFGKGHPEATIPGDVGMRGFRFDAESISCYVRCPTYLRGSSCIYLYNKDLLKDFLEREGPDVREHIKVTDYGYMCELFPEYAQDVEAIQAAVSGLINFAAALAVCGEDKMIPEVREYLIEMVEYMLTSAETNPNVTDVYWADKKYGELVDQAVASARETGKAPGMSGTDAEALYTGLDLYIRELISDGEHDDRIEQSRKIAARLQQEWPSAADHPELFTARQMSETGPQMGGMV